LLTVEPNNLINVTYLQVSLSHVNLYELFSLYSGINAEETLKRWTPRSAYLLSSSPYSKGSAVRGSSFVVGNMFSLVNPLAATFLFSPVLAP
jgi:hypothetical protein